MARDRKLGVVIVADASRFHAGLQSATAGLQGFGKRMTSVGKQLNRRVTLPLVALGAAAVMSFANFDKAMTNSLSIMGDVSPALRKEMEKTARTVAKTTTASAKEAAEGYFFLASAGLDAKQSIAALPQVARFAQAGNFDLARATDLATDAQSALGLKAKDSAKNLENLTRVTDVFVRANELANATVEQFSSAMTEKAGASLRAFNKDIEEGTAVLAVFADQGVKGEKAGTLLTRTLEGLADNSRKNADAWEDLGVKVFDSSGEMRHSAEIIGDLEKAFAGMSVQERDAAIAKLGFNKLAKTGILMLLGNADALGTYEGKLKDAGNTTKRVADKQMESLSAQLGLAKDRMIDVGIVIGGILAPMLATAAEKLAGLVERFSELSPGMQKAILIGAGVAAVLGPMVMVVGMLATAVSGLAVAVGFLAANPVVLAIAALVLFAAAMVILYKRHEGFRDFIQRWWPVIVGIFTGGIGLVVALIIKNWDAIKAKTTGIFTGIADFFRDHWRIMLGIATLGSSEIVLRIVENWGTIKAKTATAWSAVSGAISGAWDTIKEAVKTAVSFVLQKVSTFLDGMQAMLDFMSRLPGPLGAPFRAASKAVGAAKKKVDDLDRSIRGLPPEKTITITTVFKQIGQPVSDVGAAIVAAGSRALGGPVKGGLAYLVGERGPEVFVPDRSGMILPDMTVAPALARGAIPVAASSGGSRPIIEVPLYLDGREVARGIYDPLVAENDRQVRIGRGFK